MSGAPRFSLGRIVATPGALATMEDQGISPSSLLARHVAGDWGNVPPEDAAENELSVRAGFRILSSYGEGDARLWLVSEADRSSTTILRPDEY
jgi:hypothetical protein